MNKKPEVALKRNKQTKKKLEQENKKAFRGKYTM